MTEPVVFHIQKGRLVKMPDPGTFGRGDCYLVDDGVKIYLWIGPNSSADEKFLTAASAVIKDTARKGHADIDRIEGGNEPPEFKALFDDFKLTDDDTAGILKKVQLEKHEYKLWRVSREGDEITIKTNQDIWYHPKVNGIVKDVYKRGPVQFGGETREGYTATSQLKSYSKEKKE